MSGAPIKAAAAYLIQTESGDAVTLDHARAVDYAAQKHGIVRDLVLGSEARELLAALESICVLVNQPDPSRNIPFIREACAGALKS